MVLRKQINAGLHIITVGTEATLNKYSVAVPYEDGAYRALIAEQADIYVYSNIRLVDAWVRRAGFNAGRNE